jgi:sulfide:quinone oxidoreductase
VATVLKRREDIMSTTTLVLGGGFGGLACARTLRQRLPATDRVVVIDRADTFVVGATKTWTALGDRGVHTGTPRRRLLPAGVELVEAEVTAIDAGRRRIETSSGSLEADHLVIALGAEPDPSAVPGLDAAETFYTLEGAMRLAPRFVRFDSGKLVILIARPPFKCPPAPYEAALLFEAALRERGVRSRVGLEIWTAEPAPMPTAGAAMGGMIRAELERRGIGFHPRHAVVEVDVTSRVVRFGDGASASYDLLVAVPPHRVPRVVVDAGLAEAGGWIEVDPGTLEVQADGVAPHVHAIGDVTRLPLPGRYDPGTPLVLPKAGVFAAAQGEVVARRIAAAVAGTDDPTRFTGEGFCYLEVGEKHAIRAEGFFFALPHPVMQAAGATEDQFLDKLRWVEEWSGVFNRESAAGSPAP